MVLPLIAGLASAASTAASLWAAYQGQAAQARSQEEAKKIMEAARAEIAKIVPPDIESQKIFYEELESQGTIIPELEQTVQQQNSEMANISTDPALRQAQMDALARMQNIGEDGLDAEGRFRLNQISNQQSQQNKGQQDAIMQGAQRRGMGSSSNTLAAQLMAQQAGANRANVQGQSVAALAEKQALDAMLKSGQLGGDIRTQDFDEDARRAEAQDAINKFNTSLRGDTAQRNVDRRNDAQQTNLEAQQELADKNTLIRNKEQEHNTGLIQKDYENRLDRADLMYRGSKDAASGARSSGNTAAASWNAGGQAFGQLGSTLADYATRDSKKKKKEE